MLEAAGDPDRDFLRQAGRGATRGDPGPATSNTARLRRAAEVAARKLSLGSLASLGAHYSSVEEHADFARAKFEEDVREGLMAKMSRGSSWSATASVPP